MKKYLKKTLLISLYCPKSIFISELNIHQEVSFDYLSSIDLKLMRPLKSAKENFDKIKDKKMITDITTPTQETPDNFEILALATDVAAAYLANNTVALEDMPAVLETAFKALTQLSCNTSVNANRPDPVVPINQSITDDFIICLEDGKKLKMLKRHLKSSYNMTPEQYRERWGLSADYPMVAPNYAKRRSNLAMEIGLGRKRKVA